jgi:tight adherence protein B
MEPLVLVIAALVLLAVTFVIRGFAGPGTADPGSIAARLDIFRPEAAAPVSDEEHVLRLKQRSYSGMPILSAFLGQFKGSEKVALNLERAGVPLRVGEFYMIRWGMAGAFFVLPFIFGFELFNLGLAFGAALAGYMLPAYWLNSKKNARLKRINAQLVEMLGLVSNSLKSGYGLMQSFEFASRQMEPPLGFEIRRLLREANLGMSAEDALNAMGERIASSDLDMVLTAINIQRTVGGNLAEILDRVAFTMRERERIRGEIATLTSQQRMTGTVIGSLPILMFVLFMLLNPGYMSLLFTEMAGRMMLVAAIVMETLGFLTIKKIMAIEV